MSLWLVRGGRNGEYEDYALKNNRSIIGWGDLPDLSDIKTRSELMSVYEKIYPDFKKNKAANQVGQIWAFINRIKVGDLVIMPLKHRSAIAIGKITGPYFYINDIDAGVFHVRSIEWIKTNIPRTSFDQDLLYSFGAIMTVCQIQRHDAEKRIIKIINSNGNLLPETSEKEVNETADESEPIVQDIEQAARDQIQEFINRRFKGHDLARLIDGLLKAQGYITKRSEPGADGGVDILAGSGPMGFSSPKICVQVKSSESPADVNVLRALQGSINNFGADQGLLVSWGGFTRAVIEESRRSFFQVRLWDSGDLLEAIFNNYDSISDDLRAELPLKNIWSLVIDEDEE